VSLFDLGARLARQLPAETAHRATIAALKAGMGPGAPALDDPVLAVTLKRSGLKLPNPVGLAAGFDKNAEAFRAMLGFGFGFVECGTVTPKPQAGNPLPRLFRLEEDRAVINRMGFNNEGLQPFVARLSARAGAAAKGRGLVGANVGANKDSTDRAADYVTGVRAVWADCDYVTINISSPNTPGLRGLQDRGALEDLLGRVGEAAIALESGAIESGGGARPIFLKVAPDLDETAIGDIAEVALAASRLHGLIVSNTTLARPETLRSPNRSETGGLSGAPLMEPSTRVLGLFAEAVGGRLDLIGAGGISSGRDALAKLKAGASAVQLYSAMAYEGPGIVRRIKAELATLLKAEAAA
jgi:dihydroorotate dehydrogenase